MAMKGRVSPASSIVCRVGRRPFLAFAGGLVVWMILLQGIVWHSLYKNTDTTATNVPHFSKEVLRPHGKEHKRRRHQHNPKNALDTTNEKLPKQQLHRLALAFEATPVPPRAFVPWPSHRRPLPCYDPYPPDYYSHSTGNTLDDVVAPPVPDWRNVTILKRSARRGLFYLKLTKTASSTAAGVHLRVALKLLQRNIQPPSQPHIMTVTNNTSYTTNADMKRWPICRVRFLHGHAGPRLYRYSFRSKLESFLWTTLRHPTTRYISEYFHFHVTREGRNLTLQGLTGFLRGGPHSDHHSLSWLSTQGYRIGRTDPYQTARQIINDYDFIGVTERLDESLVVLSLLLQIPLRDVLYLSTKRAGGYDDGEYQNTCYRIRKPQLTQSMRQILQGHRWRAYIAPELALWEAANASLNMTIIALGRDHVQTQLLIFQQVLQKVELFCGNTTVFPCTPNGTRIASNQTDCILGDMGCGFDCIDRVADEFGLP